MSGVKEGFALSQKLLCSQPGSFLEATFSEKEEPLVTNEEGEVVLERDPKLFKYVANYLRLPYKTKIIVPDAETKEDLKAEFSFLKL